MLLKKILCIILLFTLQYKLQAQITISGDVTDSTGVGIPFTQVLLYHNDSCRFVVSYTQADNNGRYKMLVEPANSETFLIVFRSIGYAEYKKNISLNTSAAPQNISVPTVQLKLKPVMIKDVSITRARPVTHKKDTTIYSIKAFVKGNEQVVEDVLKRLPGLDVDDDGKVKFKGKEVEKIMIENDDLFGKGYQMVSKNLHASAIDKVEVYNHYSEDDILKSVEKSDKIALNLKLNEDSKFRPFGNITLGYTTDKRYDTRLNAMSLGKKVKLYLFGNSNQHGYSPLSDLGQFSESLFQNRFDPPKQRISLSIPLPNLNRKHIRFNTSNLISLNTIIKPTDRFRIKLTSFVMREDDKYNRNSTYTYTLPNTSFTNTEDYGIKSQNLSGYINLEMDLKHTTSAQTKYKFSLGKERIEERSNLIFNTDSTREDLQSYFAYMNHYIGHTHQIDSNNILKVDADLHYSKRPESYHVNLLATDDSASYLPMASGTKQHIETNTRYMSINATLLSRPSDNLLLSTSLGSSSINSSIASSTRVAYQNHDTLLNNQYVGSSLLKQTNFFVGEKATYQFNENFNLSGYATYHVLLTEKDKNHANSKGNNYFYLEPSINIEWKNDKNTLKLGCAINTSTTSIAQVYDKRMVEGYRNISMGLGHFYLFKGYSAIGNYQRGSWLSNSFLNIIFIFNHNPKYLGYNYTITPNMSLSTGTINNKQNLFVLNLTSDHFIRPIRNNLKILINAVSSSYSRYINNINTPIAYYSGNAGMELRSVFRGIFNYHIGTKINYGNINNIGSHSNMQFVDLYMSMSNSLSLTAKTERYYFNETSGGDNPIYFIDVELKYNAIANRLSFTIEAANLLNNNKYQTYNVTETQMSNLAYRLIPRNLKLSLTLRL